MDPCFKVTEPIVFDNSIADIRHFVYDPVAGSNLNNGSQIMIIIENKDAYFLPSKSFLLIKGKLNVPVSIPDVVSTNFAQDPAIISSQDSTLTNNAPMFLFRNIEYILGTKSIEYVNNPGHASLMKGLLSYSPSDGDNMNMGWYNDDLDEYTLTDTAEHNGGYKIRYNKYNVLCNGNVSFIIPLSHIFGFCEDYQKVVYGMKHTIILTRNVDSNSIVSYPVDVSTKLNVPSKFELTELKLAMATVTPSLETQQFLNRVYNGSNTLIPIVFRSRNLQELSVSESNTFTWKMGPIKKPRYFIIGFQTNRSNNYRNAAIFDHCNAKRVFVELNAERYPKVEFQTDFETQDCAWVYHFAQKFRESYYQTQKTEDFMLRSEQYGKFYPLFVIDVSRQCENIKDSVTDVTIKAEFNEVVPSKTNCYCLVISETILTQNTSNGYVTEAF